MTARHRPLIMGVDPSLAGTGVAVTGSAAPGVHMRTVHTPAPGRGRAPLPLEARVSEIVRQIRDEAQTRDVRVAAIMGARIQLQGSWVVPALQTAELRGAIRQALWELGVYVVEVPPSTLRGYVTGSDSAPDAEVVDAARRQWGHMILRPDRKTWGTDSQAFALGLCAAGVDATYGPLPGTRDNAPSYRLERLGWPILGDVMGYEDRHFEGKVAAW